MVPRSADDTPEIAAKDGQGAASRDASAASTRGKDAIAALISGLAPMTRVGTDFGMFPAQALRLRDRIRTERGGFAAVDGLDRLRLNEDFLRRHPEANPVLIRAGALGSGRPFADIVVAPGQLVCSTPRPRADAMKPAYRLLGRPGVTRVPETLIVYTRIEAGNATSIEVEGIWAHIGL